MRESLRVPAHHCKTFECRRNRSETPCKHREIRCNGNPFGNQRIRTPDVDAPLFNDDSTFSALGQNRKRENLKSSA